MGKCREKGVGNIVTELNLDFLNCLKSKIKTLYSGTVKVGVLDTGESISIMQMQGGSERRFYDGSRDKNFNIQVAMKSNDSNNCYNTLTNIAYTLSNSSVNSVNNSYEFTDLQQNGEVSLISQTEDEEYIYAVNMIASLHIKKGVVI